MTRKRLRKVVLTSVADFFNGMATAWAFAAYDSLSRLAWMDLLSALLLAILSLRASIGMKLPPPMINVHDLIRGGIIGVPLLILAFAVVYLVFFRDTDESHKSKPSH